MLDKLSFALFHPILITQVQQRVQEVRSGSWVHRPVTLCGRLQAHLLFKVEKGWVRQNIDQRVWLLTNTPSASHVTDFIAWKKLSQTQ